MKAKYDAFMKAEYSVESAVSLIGNRTEKMKALEAANEYNFMLYFVHFLGHLEQMETMRNIGDINEISNLEMNALMPGVDVLQSMQYETANIAPEDINEDGVYSRIATQFSWGSRYNPPFSHSSDALNAVVATMAKLGK
jgi:hypothetical protein